MQWQCNDIAMTMQWQCNTKKQYKDNRNKMAELNEYMSFESIFEQLQCVGFPDDTGKEFQSRGAAALKSWSL